MPALSVTDNKIKHEKTQKHTKYRLLYSVHSYETLFKLNH